MPIAPTQNLDIAREAGWESSRLLANGIRLIVFLLPLIVAWAVIAVSSQAFIRPEGVSGLVLWIVQGIVVGSTAAILTDRLTRNLLPLAALFNMSLVFPDATPSRFRVALRTGTVKQLLEREAGGETVSLASDPQQACIDALALVTKLGNHDRLTRGHSERVRAYADLIAEELGVDAYGRSRLSWAALLHDIGKLEVPHAVLNAERPPTKPEWAILQQHPEHAARLLEPLQEWLGEWIGAATEHHERIDGAGYPLGLAGSEISLAGRIVAVADAYDTITSRRSYKAPVKPDAARQELVRCAGTHFDATVVRAFLNLGVRSRWITGPFAWLAEVPPIVSRTIGAGSIPALSGVALSIVAALTMGSGAAVGEPIPIDLAAAVDDVDETAIVAPTTPTISPTSTPTSNPGTTSNTTQTTTQSSTQNSTPNTEAAPPSSASTTTAAVPTTTATTTTVVAPNRPPTFVSLPPSTPTWVVGQPELVTITGTDPDDDPVSFTVTGGPPWISVSQPSPGQLLLTSSLHSNDLGSAATMTIVAKDDSGGSSEPATVTVNVASFAKSPLAGSVVISELVHWEKHVESEFIEIWNRGTSPVALDRLVLTDYGPYDAPDTNHFGSFRTRLGPGTLAPGERLTVKVSDGILNHTGLLHTVSPAGRYIESSGEDIWLFDAAAGESLGIVVDFVSWYTPNHGSYAANQELTTTFPPEFLGLWSQTPIDLGTDLESLRGYSLVRATSVADDHPSCWVKASTAPPPSCAGGFVTIGRFTPGLANG